MAILLAGSLLAAGSAAVAVEAGADPLRPVDTSSPRATLLAFREDTEKAHQSWRENGADATTTALIERVLRTLDLGRVGEALRQEIGIADALYLYETLNRIELPDPADVPDAAAVEARGLTRWSIPKTEITIARVDAGERAGEFLFTADTITRAKHFYELTKGLRARNELGDLIETWRAAPGPGMPDPLAAGIWELPPWAFLSLAEQPAWKWVAVLSGLLLTVACAWLAWRLGRTLDGHLRRAGSDWRIGQLVAVVGALAAASALDWWVERAVLFREQPGVAASVALMAARYLLLAWLVAALIAGLGRLAVRGLAAGTTSLDAALIRLCFRILSIAAALVVVLHAAGELGLSITPMIAGLGVGGLAVALAIRPTLENVIGGFVLFADKPVRVGEFCAFDDKAGTVEEIGLRSTRLRGVDRAVITVPNADFAQMQIVNYTRRDMNLFQCQIGLRRETTPDQLRYVAAKIRKLLIRHSEVSPDPARVRLSELGGSAYVLDVFAFVRAAEWDKFLAIKEDLNLRIAEIVRESGTQFAFPAQTVYFARDGGVDLARGAATEAEVRKWREEQRLPFPNYDFAEQAEMADTLPYPPEGSPDHRPAPAAGAADAPPERPEKRRFSGWPPLFRRKPGRTPASVPAGKSRAG